MLTPPKVDRLVVPFPHARVWLSLTGTMGAETSSQTRRRQTTAKLMLRCQFDADVTVLLERRRTTRWEPARYTGNDMQQLILLTAGEDVRLVVQGPATGVAELVEVG